MTDAQFSALTSIFSVGGLVGSAGANVVMDGRGRRGALRISAALTALGAFLMTIASGYTALVIGRCVSPALQRHRVIVQPNRLPQTPSRRRCRHRDMPDSNLHCRSIASENPRQSRSVHSIESLFSFPAHIITGVFTQFSIVVGIMITQLIGFKLATPTTWRYVLLLSGLTATAQFFVSSIMVESPVWAVRNGDPQSGKAYHQKLWKDVGSHCGHSTSFKFVWFDQNSTAPDEDPLLARDPDDEREQAVSVPHALKTSELRLPLTIASLAMVSQQISGIVLNVLIQSHTNESMALRYSCECRYAPFIG